MERNYFLELPFVRKWVLNLKKKFCDSHYQEYVAIEILKQIDSEKYGNCNKSEKPDWINETKSFGIEIVTIIDKKIAEEGSIWLNKNSSEIKFWGLRPFVTIDLLKEKIIDKNNKAKTYSQQYLELYIIVEEPIYDNVEYSFEKVIWDFCKEIDIKYTHLYFDMIDKIYIFDIKNHTLNIIDEDKYQTLRTKAMSVLKKENNYANYRNKN